ncbi:hypothetical protein [Clostridium algidicarnis]|uniref:Uncharacterized protein n=2 Tax=Clostridium algidicarnis TaxID=37659 RepID=A0A2S6G022_9CLOT|nr:hypothetical protein [Clostridium algidicarnis]MBB6630843.1 hypothetical protein [Clostridium algidicarnis]MBB6696745.1 hypothetical protein [Clostridium algidicarnis]MBU3192692.1 hypothetical protein [Clostridium algidicarnis]MBU3196452.1 hypothetical protein [Clostridium algidicarnis]MBU3207374.1 hypothetical protein [Clostridium algidicarnis]
MGNRSLIESHYADMNNLVDILCKLVTSYRAMVGGAHELNGVALVEKKQIKEALKTADELNDLIRNIIDTLECCEDCYLDYCRIKSQVLKSKINTQYILDEIDDNYEYKYNNEGMGKVRFPELRLKGSGGKATEKDEKRNEKGTEKANQKKDITNTKEE